MREYLCVTLSFNHALLDGAPAARFAERLRELIESGYDLVESEVQEPVAFLLPAPLASSCEPPDLQR